jgi:hypothetical protein
MRLGAAIFPNEPIAFDRASATHHHGAVFIFGHARHAARHLLKAFAIGRADFGKKINIATCANAPVEVTGQHRQFLLLGHGPFIKVGTFVGFETGTVVCFHEGHTKLVQPIAFA